MKFICIKIIPSINHRVRLRNDLYGSCQARIRTEVSSLRQPSFEKREAIIATVPDVLALLSFSKAELYSCGEQHNIVNKKEAGVTTTGHMVWRQAPQLNGLVLTGGKSVRMGKDKGALQWHGTEQRIHLAGLLRAFCAEVFLSCRPDQLQELAERGENLLPDVFENLGPCGALLSAFEKNRHCAWLVTACDLPLLDHETLSQLVSERDPDRMATAFESPLDGLPEPLVAIWEPGSYPVLLASLEKGYLSLRKTLMNQNVKMIRANNSNALLNVNTPQEMEEAQRLLAKLKSVKEAN